MMDVTLLKTFTEVVASDSFSAASERLFVSQSAVSLRIKTLEELLGRKVFVRSKTGIELTPAGKQFERYAHSMLQAWEEAKQQVAIPDDYTDVLVIAGEYELWNRLLVRWLPKMAQYMPKVAFRVEIAGYQKLTRQMVEGITDISVMYTPQIRPGILVKKLFDDLLIMVSTDINCKGIDDDYVFVDWGEEFGVFHATNFPEYQHPRITFGAAPPAVNFLLNNGGCAYLPKRLVDVYLDEQQLFIVPDMPEMNAPVHVAWRDQVKSKLIEQAIHYLELTAKQSIENGF